MTTARWLVSSDWWLAKSLTRTVACYRALWVLKGLSCAGTSVSPRARSLQSSLWTIQQCSLGSTASAKGSGHSKIATPHFFGFLRCDLRRKLLRTRSLAHRVLSSWHAFERNSFRAKRTTWQRLGRDSEKTLRSDSTCKNLSDCIL